MPKAMTADSCRVVDEDMRAKISKKDVVARWRTLIKSLARMSDNAQHPKKKIKVVPIEKLDLHVTMSRLKDGLDFQLRSIRGHPEFDGWVEPWSRWRAASDGELLHPLVRNFETAYERFESPLPVAPTEIPVEDHDIHDLIEGCRHLILKTHLEPDISRDDMLVRTRKLIDALRNMSALIMELARRLEEDIPPLEEDIPPPITGIPVDSEATTPPQPEPIPKPIAVDRDTQLYREIVAARASSCKAKTFWRCPFTDPSTGACAAKGRQPGGNPSFRPTHSINAVREHIKACHSAPDVWSTYASAFREPLESAHEATAPSASSGAEV